MLLVDCEYCDPIRGSNNHSEHEKTTEINSELTYRIEVIIRLTFYKGFPELRGDFEEPMELTVCYL